jgi:hypothetical protein
VILRCLLVFLISCAPIVAQFTTYQPVRPVAPNITLGFDVYTTWRTQPHNGIDYVSNLGNVLMSVGGGGIISPLGYTKPNASGFGSIDPDGAGPAIWMKYNLATGEPIYVLYGHTATSWDDATTGVGSALFNFACTYTVQWHAGDSIGANTVVGQTAPYYLNTRRAPHLHVSVFKPNKTCNNGFCPPPLSGWGYSQIHLPTGDYINPEELFTNAQYMLRSPDVTLYISDGGSPGCLSPSGSVIKMAANGSGASTLASISPPPAGIAVNMSGTAYVVQPCGKSVSKVTAAGSVSTVLSGSPLHTPVAIAVDSNENLIVGDNTTDSIFRINPANNSIVEVAKLQPSPVNFQDIAIVVDDAGNYIVGNDDVGGIVGISQILKITPAGAVTIIFSGSTIHSITGIAIDSGGNYIVSDFRQSAVFRVTPAGIVSVIAAGPSLCCNLVGLAQDPVSGKFISTLNFGDKVLAISPGTVSTVFSGSPLRYPNGVAIGR